MRNAMLGLLAAGAATIAGSGPVVAIDYPYCIQGRGWGVPRRRLSRGSAEPAAGVQLGVAFDAGARIAGDDLAEA
jgi:hypothetical protein